MKQNNFRKRPETKRKHKINQELNFTEVRIVGRGEPFVISTKEALDIAFSEEKDLILINENQNPPIVRIEDYNKFLYNAEKAEKEKKRNSNKSQLKEIQLSVNISLKGRQKANPARGELVMLKFAQLVEEFGIPESMPKLESGKWLMMMKTKKKG
jgi:translation initiation factor IF-3